MAKSNTILLRHIDLLATVDDTRREITDGAVLIEQNRIAQIGTTT